MKKITFLLMLALIAVSTVTFAKKIVIKVADFQFTNSTVNAKVGDTIIFKWVSGTHTTTSTSVPTGARTWDHPMDASHKKFRYILKVKGTYKYVCNFHSQMTGTINVTAPSAADVNEFTLSGDDNKAVLNWKTTSSTDISYFSVQRSTDGNNFTEIAKVNANTSNLYSFKDNSTLSDKYIYYQVAMMDVNGNKQLSPIQMFTNIHTGITKLITSLSPNPVSAPGHLMLQFNADKDGFMIAKLYNQSGLLVKEATFSAMKGLNNGHFHLGSLSPGTYYIVFTLGDITEKHTIIMK